MNTPVYAEHITTLSDARYYSGMGVKWLGISSNPKSPNYLPPERFREIAGWVTGPQFVLEIDDLDNPDLSKLTQDYGISFFRINPLQIDQLKQYDCGIKLSGDSPGFKITQDAAFVICESQASVTTVPPNVIILLPSPDSQLETEKILSHFPSVGFVVEGSNESAVGIKEYHAMELLEFLDGRD